MPEFAAIVVAVLLGGVAMFQLSLAIGAPYGDHAYGGRAPTNGGRLPTRYRIMSGLALPLLVLSSWVVLVRAGAVGHEAAGDGWVGVAVWVVVAYLVLNTAANLASTSKIERTVMGSVTAVAACATLIVALAA